MEHSNRAHALLSASSAHRWLNCTPSAKLERKQKESKQSSYALEGTLAHEFAELFLRLEFGEVSKRSYNSELKKLRKNQYYTDEMEGEVKKYTDYCVEEYGKIRRIQGTAEYMIEQRLDFSDVVNSGFGTGDFGIVSDKVLSIIDLKYGKGVKVDAQENPQLMLYGIGALNDYDLIFEIEYVHLTIIQPRLNHISNYVIPKQDLINWGQNIVKKYAQLAYNGEGKKFAGSWCKFCKVNALCKTFADFNLSLAAHDFKEPDLLTDEELISIFEQQPLLSAWVSSVKDYLLKEAINGKKWPGYKVVEGVSRRKWKDEEGLTKTLEESFDIGEITEQKLLTITKMEKFLKAEKYDISKIEKHIFKPQGAPNLVKDSDKRPAMGIEQAIQDFS